MPRFRSREYALGWLAGMVDGGGSIDFKRLPGRYGHIRRFRVVSTDIELIDGVCEALEWIDVRHQVQTWVYKRRYAHYRPLHIVTVYDQDGLTKLAAALDLRHPLKGPKLAAIPASFRPKVQLERDTLYQLHVVEARSLREVADMLGVNWGHVQRAVKQYGINISQSDKLKRAWLTRRRARVAAS